MQPTIPKNINQEFGGNIGGPIYIPKILTGKKKLFFFTNFDRITQRSLASAPETVPDSKMNRATSPKRLRCDALRSAAAGCGLGGHG